MENKKRLCPNCDSEEVYQIADANDGYCCCLDCNAVFYAPKTQ